MAKNPRITVTLSLADQKKLNTVLDRLDLNSSGQLLRMLVSGDSKRLEWIFDEFKKG